MGEFSSFEEVSRKFVCGECIGEEYLRALIKGKEYRSCSYCESVSVTCISITELASHVEKAVREHFCRTSAEPDDYESALMRDRESSYEWERAGDPILTLVAEILGSEESVAGDILEVLSDRYDTVHPGDPDEGEGEFSLDAHYEEKPVSLSYWSMEWLKLENALKYESRFFNPTVMGVLQSVFANLHTARSYRDGFAIVTVGPGSELTALYRGREFQSQDELYKALKSPLSELGPPPGRLARANRMNASGISVFYGAEDAHSALAEVRPVVGSKVAVAMFTIIRSLKLLDLRKLESVGCSGSFFDPAFTEEFERVQFLRTLTKRLTIPVMPNEKDREYLTTQAVADYLAGLEHPTIDGILFPSVQDGVGVNVALFHKASLVEPLIYPDDVRIEAALTEYDVDSAIEYPEYSISIRPPLKKEKPVLDAQFFFQADCDNHDFSQSSVRRQPALKLELQSIEIHEITAVKVVSKSSKVRVFDKVELEKFKPADLSDDF